MTSDVTQRLSRRHLLQGTALVLGSLAGSSILAACGGAAPPPPAPPAKPAEGAKPAESPAAAAPAAAAKPATAGQRVVIRDHDWLQGTPGQAGDWYDAFIAKFEDEHPDIKVEREWFPRQETTPLIWSSETTGDTVRINVAPVVSELQIKGVV